MISPKSAINIRYYTKSQAYTLSLIYYEIAPRSVRLRTNYVIAPGDNVKNNFGDIQKAGPFANGKNIFLFCLSKVGRGPCAMIKLR